MKERRLHKRLNIPLPVRVNAMNGDVLMALDLETRDISYSGTFIPTLTSFPERTRFILDFTIPSDNLKDLKNVDSLIGCKGTMIRSTPNGIAIEFDKECRIKNLKNL